MNPADQDPDFQAGGFMGPDGKPGAQAHPRDSDQPGRSEAAAGSGRIRRGFVTGERGTPVVGQAVSLQSRISSVMAAALMIALGLGLLGWYYTRVITRHAHAHAPASAGPVDAQSLPALGPIEPPRVVAIDEAAETAPMPGRNAIDLASLPRVPMEANAGAVGASCLLEAGSCGTESMTPARRALERRLFGAPFAHRSARAAGGDRLHEPVVDVDRGAHMPAPAAPAASVMPATGGYPAGSGPRAGNTSAARGGDSGGVTNLLQRDVAAAVRAQVLPTRRLLLPKGAFIDCTLETAIDSTLPGMTTCITAIDTFGADGKVVLLERGTKLVGETRGQARHGAARVFVVWTEARTPTGVVVALDSPGTDELGRSGLPGKVERHFWDRFGAAILISMIDGATQAAVQSAGSGNATVIYNPSSSRDILTEVLRGTIDIPPTITKAQGERIQVLVARDLDFSTVYELRVRRQPPAHETGAAAEG